MNLFELLAVETILVAGALVLFVLGFAKSAGSRLAAPVIATATVLIALVVAALQWPDEAADTAFSVDGAIRIGAFAYFVRVIVLAIGALLVLLAWPNRKDGTGGSAVDWGRDAGEFFALVLLALAGATLVAGANDLILLFMGIELASIPTYILVSMSRPTAQAQEAGVKYFFLGAMSAAVMLMGFSFLYGITGTTDMYEIGQRFSDGVSGPIPLGPWGLFAAVMLVGGLAFKMAAAPLHFYAADVYEGAGTPVTALLSFVPKTVGVIAMVKIFFTIGGNGFDIWPQISLLLAILAAITMTVGNVLGLVQFTGANVKRVLAYSSIAHSGYLLVGLAALTGSPMNADVQGQALAAVLFYLVAYGLMNVGSFGVMLLLPHKPLPGETTQPATSAETFDDLAGMGKKHPLLGLAMAVSMFSLIGLPLTIGFWGKLGLLLPAWNVELGWLVIFTVVNAAISAGYYLKILSVMYLRDEVGDAEEVRRPLPIAVAIATSCFLVILFGTLPQALNRLDTEAQRATTIDRAPATIAVAE
ncbi:MAG: NADH-quinone oxidoreductase subunit N [Planctomycetota bacterium]